ncbi:MAG TPA: hypothetical protein VMU71_11650 [Terracidiphilus sp.]|nr:hypothetical protein [Terracidiphilus sp.]
MYFWIHIVPSRSPAGPRFMFSVANMQGPGGSVPYLTFETPDSLTACLQSINVREEDIGEMHKVLATGEAFSLPDVDLTDEDLRKLGLYVLANVPERSSAVSAVEGLKLGSEGAERLERTKRLRPEERRANTIHAFKHLRKSG